MSKFITFCFTILIVIVQLLSQGFASEVRIDQSNLPNTPAAYTAMSWDMSQTFKPGMDYLNGVDIDILTINPNLGDDVITVQICRPDAENICAPDQVLGSAAVAVSVGFNGLLHFDFPTDIPLDIGETYIIHKPGGKDTFGWKFDGDTYEDGIRYLGGVPKNEQDWFFQTYGTVAAQKTIAVSIMPSWGYASLITMLLLLGIISIRKVVD